MNHCKDMEKNCCTHPNQCMPYMPAIPFMPLIPCMPATANRCCCNGKSGDGDTETRTTGRIMLDSDLVIYVRKDGSDLNDGLTDSPCGAKLTIAGALRSLFRFDAQGYAMKIIIHEGEYEEALSINAAYNSIGFSSLTLQAFEGETVNVTQDYERATIGINAVNAVIFKGLTITNAGNDHPITSCIMASLNAFCDFENCRFVCSVPYNHAIYVTYHSHIFLVGNNTINVQNGRYIFRINAGSYIRFTGTVHNESVSATDYIGAVNNSTVDAYEVSFTGTGAVTSSTRKYELKANSSLRLIGVAIPGTGTSVDSGGVVV